MKFHHQYQPPKKQKEKKTWKDKYKSAKTSSLVGSKRRKMRDLRNRNRISQTRKKDLTKVKIKGKVTIKLIKVRIATKTNQKEE